MLPRQVRKVARSLLSAVRNNKAVEPYWIDVEQQGAKIRFLVANLDGKSWYGPYAKIENREMTFLQEKVLRPGMNVVEVGAHQGFTAALIARWVGPRARCSPSSRCSRIATSPPGVRENAGQCHADSRGGWRENGSVFIGSTTTNPNVQTNGFLGEECPVVRLDDQIEGTVDLLKIDVEGYELHVLRGAQRLLETRPHLQIEVHPGPIIDFGGVVQTSLT